MQAKPSANTFPSLNPVAKPKNASCSHELEPHCFCKSQADPSPGKHSSASGGLTGTGSACCRCAPILTY